MAQRMIEVEVVTPEGSAFAGSARAVVVPAYDGEMAFLPGHAPLVGSLGVGELRVLPREGDVRRFVLQGGVVRVLDDQVVILAESVEPLASLDADAERERLADALAVRAVGSLEALDARELAADAARARLRLARREGDPDAAS